MSEAIINRLGEAFAEAEGQREAVSLIVYMPFGIVRGEVDRSQLQAASSPGRSGGTIEIHRAIVEHYSNHLPTGNYALLTLNLANISGFVVLEEQWRAGAGSSA